MAPDTGGEGNLQSLETWTQYYGTSGCSFCFSSLDQTINPKLIQENLPPSLNLKVLTKGIFIFYQKNK